MFIIIQELFKNHQILKNLISLFLKVGGNIWNRLVRSNIFIKGLLLLNDLTLNYYKNVWYNIWCNTFINKISYSFLVIERIGYIYLFDGEGFGSPKSRTQSEKDKKIK